MTRLQMRVSAARLSSPDVPRLAAFYETLLGWVRMDDEPEWVRLRPPSGGVGLSFHHDEHYRRPVWPSTDEGQQMMVHLDIATNDLQAAVDRAIELGASPADHQPQERVRVMFDPDGHPFCLFQGGPRSEFDATDWNGVGQL
jgi:catechol 2,3-dioxygenase-like lactoylglutathione lyase family enzyme